MNAALKNFLSCACLGLCSCASPAHFDVEKSRLDAPYASGHLSLADCRLQSEILQSLREGQAASAAAKESGATETDSTTTNTADNLAEEKKKGDLAHGHPQGASPHCPPPRMH